MKLILLKDSNLGKKFEVKEFKDGHAKNFIIPRGLAILATPLNLKNLEKQKLIETKKEIEIKKELEALADQLKDKKIIFPVDVDKTGSVYGSVGKEAVLNSLRDLGFFTKNRVEIEMDRPLKEIGEYKIKINLSRGISREIFVVLEAKKIQ